MGIQYSLVQPPRCSLFKIPNVGIPAGICLGLARKLPDLWRERAAVLPCLGGALSASWGWRRLRKLGLWEFVLPNFAGSIAGGLLMGATSKSSIYRWIFHEINHSGIPSWLWKSAQTTGTMPKRWELLRSFQAMEWHFDLESLVGYGIFMLWCWKVCRIYGLWMIMLEKWSIAPQTSFL